MAWLLGRKKWKSKYWLLKEKIKMCNKCKRNQKRKIIDKSNLFEINFSGLCEECFEDKIEDYYVLKEETLKKS